MSVRRPIVSAGYRALAAVTMAVAATALVPAPAQATPAFPYLRGFQLVNVHSGKCLAIAGDGTAVVQQTCLEERSHLWRMRLVSLSGLFQIQNLRSGQCLTVAGGAGRAVQQSCAGDPSRSWRLRDAEGTGFLIHSSISGRCLTVGGAGRAENAAAVLSTCGPAGSRRWDARLIGGTEKA